MIPKQAPVMMITIAHIGRPCRRRSRDMSSGFHSRAGTQRPLAVRTGLQIQAATTLAWRRLTSELEEGGLLHLLPP